MQLKKIIKITATLKCLSGLHIGGGDTQMHIGGIDNCVVKHPLTHQPYIPGSSLKGKMRSLLEWRTGAVKEGPLTMSDWKNCGQDDLVMQIIQLFGCGGSQQLSVEDCEKIGPSRLSFWDCALSEDFVKEVTEANMMFTETKAENTINRITGTAEHPRLMERVLPDSRFDFQLTLKHLDGDDEEKLLKTVFIAMKLLELDSLGGSGSRGYGKVKFENVCINGTPASQYDALDPFAG